MMSEVKVPGDVNPVVRMAEIKDQEIADILEYMSGKNLLLGSGFK